MSIHQLIHSVMNSTGCCPLSCVKLSLAQSCLTLCNPMDYSPPGSSVHGILQARILEWAAMPSFRASSRLRDRTQVSCIAGRFFTIWAREGQIPSRWSIVKSLFSPSFYANFLLEAGSFLFLSITSLTELSSLKSWLWPSGNSGQDHYSPEV